MTVEQALISVGGGVIVLLLAVSGFFLKRALSKVEERLDHLDQCLDSFKLQVEKGFVSFETFETLRSEFRKNFQDIFKEQAEHGKILARLDERSDWSQRFAQILDRIAPRGN